MSCQYFRWLVGSWFSWFEDFLSLDVGAFWVDAPSLWPSSFESLIISVLYLLGNLAASGPFQHVSAAWLVFWQCEQSGHVFAFDLSMDCFSRCRSCSLRMLFRYSLGTCLGLLEYRQKRKCCSESCDWVCLFSNVVVVAIVGRGGSPSVSNPLITNSCSTKATIPSYVPFSNILDLLTVWDVEVKMHKTNCLLFVVHVVPTLFLHSRWFFQWALKAISCWGEKWVSAICVLLWLVIMVWRTFVGIWRMHLQVFVYGWSFCF